MKSIHDIFLSYGKTDSEGKHIDGTDKATNHNYGDVYDQLFPDRSIIYTLLELGVSRGGSMLAWCDIFPNARVVGMDIDDNCTAKGERIEHHVGNVCVYEDCYRVANERLFDVIIDDADHNVGSILQALLHFWPHVKSGGLYVIEDFAQGHLNRTPVINLVYCFRYLFPQTEIYKTIGPRGGYEPIIVLRKP